MKKPYPDANIWEISRPILEDWIKKEKGPEAKIKKTLEVSKDVLEKIPDLPDVMDKANIALQMLARVSLIFIQIVVKILSSRNLNEK